jgi:hypothetical protein
LALLAVGPRTAHAAESYDNCTGFITSLPAVITARGTWCMNQDLYTAMTSGDAIELQTSDVVIDCNNFRLDGSAAGLATQARGISALGNARATVRHCDIRGFKIGILTDGVGSDGHGGHLVEDNRLSGSTYSGIQIIGNGSVVRRNRIFNTGGSTVSSYPRAIYSELTVDILNNTISGVIAPSAANSNATGIYVSAGPIGFRGPAGRIIGNNVRGLLPAGTGKAYAIDGDQSGRVIIRNNDLVGNGSAGSFGIWCGAKGIARNNVTNGFETGVLNCVDGGGNAALP